MAEFHLICTIAPGIFWRELQVLRLPEKAGGRAGPTPQVIVSLSPFVNLYMRQLPSIPRDWRQRLPGILSTGLMLLTTSVWTFWGMFEMYWEAWWGPWALRLAYLIPAGSCFALLLLALAWPRVGGWLVIAAGAIFTAWWWSLQIARGVFSLAGALSMFPASAMLILVGALFLKEATYRRRRKESGWRPPAQWWRRNFRFVAGLGVPLLIVVGVSAFWAPTLMARVDDGRRDARLIEGNGVRLVWAPEGPGWASGSHQDDPFGRVKRGYHPSWDMIALYGVPPAGWERKAGWEKRHATAEDMRATGLCRYLAADGLTLATAPQDIWRMPTADEITRSLGRHGKNAGCQWTGREGPQPCGSMPDKETPLWVPRWSPIYMWAAEEKGDEALYVGYNAMVQSQRKSWGNPRHGFRCVREP